MILKNPRPLLGICEIRKFELNLNVFLYSNSIQTQPTVFDVSNIALASLKICYLFKSMYKVKISIAKWMLQVKLHYIIRFEFDIQFEFDIRLEFVFDSKLEVFVCIRFELKKITFAHPFPLHWS